MRRLHAFERLLSVAGREAVAYARQAWLLRHDVTAPVLPDEAADGDDVVVLLHGLLATAGVLRPLRVALERHPNVHCASITYAPGLGVADVGARLVALVDQLPPAVRLHLVGHSLGGVVARWYAEEARDPRLVQTISLASPFGGVAGAGVLGGWVRDLEPQSAVLRRIRLGDSGVPHLSIVASDDAVVRGPRSHALACGEVLVLEDCGHNGLLFHDDAIATVQRRVVASRR
jgi:pimeloyl-ACP methyl ester carboxylesterase